MDLGVHNKVRAVYAPVEPGGGITSHAAVGQNNAGIDEDMATRMQPPSDAHALNQLGAVAVEAVQSTGTEVLAGTIENPSPACCANCLPQLVKRNALSQSQGADAQPERITFVSGLSCEPHA
eukprot:CAMPEP_0115890096 /NCGR_PEP_ID=MMETSP0287-20121206/33172_1 /TAXON_ID=412157 /ORGANISM="Chrysochromulina rotalis, Strain UIO044" /LENGTH=121 /DNA_ID=CAMNT_0003346851 /DNA_START=315 /DNA_END=681 /DNA_ORIENTATION=-